MKNTVVLWFTGLSGSGKTTIAKKLLEEFYKNGKKVLLIDGDVVRGTIHKNLRFTSEDIKENNRLIAINCKENIGKYDIIIVSIISPFRESRESARMILSQHFTEVFVKADLDECIRRDVKGLYKKALAGEIENFIGISPSTPYEEPTKAEIVLNTQEENLLECIKKIKDFLRRSFSIY